MSLKYLLMASMLVIGASVVDAQEDPPLLGGTFTIAIYNGSGGGSPVSSNSQALEDNPLLDGPPVATVRCDALDFGVPRVPPQTNDSTIGGFLDSGTGECEVLNGNEGFRDLTLSASSYAIATLFDITFTESAIPDGSISHDDGISLYVDDDLVMPPGESAAPPTELATTDFSTEAGGTYRLIYVAANGNPSILSVRGTPAVPQPDFVDFACRIDLAQTGVAQAFKITLPATESEKFCPPNNEGGLLKLNCSGTIPGYPSGSEPIVSTGPSVVCRIAGAQCGRPREFVASVKSISIDSSGFAELTCEANVPPP